MPKTKRPRLALDDPANSSTTTARVSLTSLPIEILAEILLYTCSPATVLAVSRTCSFLYRSLARSPDASFIWRGVRNTFKVPLPDLGNRWKKSEADYAALVFGVGVCEVCQKATRDIYVSFAARIRLCGSWHCRRKLLDETLINVTSELQGQDCQLLWVPSVESSRCFYPSRIHASLWPYGELLLRKSDWEAFQRDLQDYKQAEQAHAEHKGNEETKRVLERCRTAKQRLTQIMEVSKILVSWKWMYDREFRTTRMENNVWTKNLASTEGWDLGDLIASQTYGSLQRRKNSLLEKIEMNDVSPIRSIIESELLALKARRQRQKTETTYKEKLTELKKIYERMRCGTLAAPGTSGSSDPLVVPPLTVFYALPSVRTLKGSPDPSALPSSGISISSDINSPLVISLITADIHTWLVPVQRRLMTVLGYPNGWQSASSRTVHPLKRATARFFCRRCGEGKVGRAYQRGQCLDFKGVCSHVCVAGPGKSIEGQHRKAPQEGEVEDNTGARKEEGGNRAKKGGSKATGWTVDVFEKDEKAISLIKTILSLVSLSEESSAVPTAMKKLGGTIRCMTCKGWIVMDFDTAIGHAHRHETMEIQLLPMSVPSHVAFFRKDARPTAETSQPIPKSRLEFERGNCELLLGLSYHGKSLCKKDNYGCRHCLIVIDQTIVAGVEKAGKGGLRAMNFNGLRSHVKEKHGIQDIRDEDFFCYTSIREGR